jgi:hypothetical protein
MEKKEFLQRICFKSIIIALAWLISISNSFSSDKIDIQTIKVSLTAETIINGNYLDLQVYITSEGDDFYLGLSSIGIVYESKILKYNAFIEEKPILFSNNATKGYSKIKSNPSDSEPNPIPNLRIIEIGFDTATKPKLPGIVVPKTKSYLGTLRFDILNKKAIYKFDWHPNTILRTVNNSNITALCDKKVIPEIVIYKASLVVPVGSESYYPNRKVDIRWSSSATYPLFVEFSADGTSWQKIDPKAIIANKQTYNWTIPDVNSTKCRIRLVDSATSFVLTQSQDFSIFQGFAQLIRPASGDALYFAGKTDIIKWSAVGYNKVRFEISLDGGTTWKLIAGPIDASVNQTGWKIPSATTKSAQMRMLDAETNLVISTSGKFKILQGTIAFKNPVANEAVINNRTYRIRWTVADIQNFDLDYSLDGGKNWTNIAVTLSSSLGYLDWSVPPIETKTAILRATWNGDPEMEFGKSGVFVLKNPLGINEGISEDSKIFPNPSSNYIELPINEDMKEFHFKNLKIFNEMGVEVPETKFEIHQNNNFLRINFIDLPKGIYFLVANEKFEKFVIW